VYLGNSGEWADISGQISASKAVRTKVGKLDGKNLENAGNMNFFLMSEVVFHLV
jgi:hypothetical protein